MDHIRVFEINNISVGQLKVGNSCCAGTGFYVVVVVAGDPTNMLKDKSPVDWDGGDNPTWNHAIKFPLDHAMFHNNQFTFRATVYRKRYFRRDNVVGNFDVPFKELFDQTGDGDSFHNVSYQLKGNHNGTINFSYRFGELLMADPDLDGYPSQVPIQEPGDGKTNLILGLATSFLGRMAGAVVSEEIASA